MTRDASQWVYDLFAARTRDCTPAPARHAARVLFAPISADPEASRLCASVLSDAELRTADSFMTQRHKAHFTQRRAFRRYCGALALASQRPLSQVVFAATGKGRPYLPEWPECWFSFSWCRLGYLGAWSPTHGIGVDIEDETRDLEARELAQRYFSEAESMAVESTVDPASRHTFFQLWTLKEAALKSIGEGLPFGLDAFQFALTPKLRVVHAPRDYGGPERFRVYAIEEAGSCAALAIRSSG
ncbi:4'-phosphopantetheinyl transferase family protein [Hyphomicrobium sp.]|uniref:4'-phosphopantetheinyl transferase family protein n=1 Tax=Hyphomicrobium sp. TaxID=82 RepID=UPI002FE2E01C